MQPALRSFLELPGGVKRFIATETLLGIGIGILNMILNLHMLALGLNPQQIGTVTSAGTIVMGLASIPSVALVTRFGRKRMLVLGIALMAVAVAGFGLGATQVHMLLAMAVWSLGMAFLVTSEIQLLFEYCREKRQESQAYASLFAVFTLFTGIGTLIGGYLPGRLGGVSSTYQYSFFAGTACIAVCAVLRALLLPAGNRLQISVSPVSPAIGEPEASGQRPHTTIRKLLLLSVSIFLLGFTFTVAGPYLNVIIQYRFAWPDERVSLLLSVTGAALFVGSLLMPPMLERFGAARAFAILFTLNAILAFVLGLPIGVGLFAGVLMLRGGLFTLLNNMIDSETMSAVAEQDRNRFAGLRSVFRSAGSALAAYIGGTVLEARDTLLPFLLTCAGLLLGWAWLWWVGLPIMRERRKPEGGTR